MSLPRPRSPPGPGAFAPREAMDRWLARARFAASVEGSAGAPDDSAVRAAIEQICEGRRSFAELREAGLLDVLRHGPGIRAGEVDRLAPERVTLAGGRGVEVAYEARQAPLRSHLGSRTSLAGEGRTQGGRRKSPASSSSSLRRTDAPCR